MAVDWIAVDWGTSQVRAYAMAGGAVRAERASDQGMGKLSPQGFEPALLALIGGWLGAGRTQVVVCGMAGARQGWIEAPYRQVPCAPVQGGAFVSAPVQDPRLAVQILPGLSQPAPADVMRGEETQIAGLLAQEPGFDGVACLPGTHAKWARISAGEVVSFQTFMTGELFALLSTQSVLRHGMAAEDRDEGTGEAAFAEGLSLALSRPERLAAQLFALRAEGLLHGLAPRAARARLSGLLIGAELAAARPYWLGQRVALIGAPALAQRYAAALALQGLTAESLDARACTLAGLTAARAT
ncbi:MAG: 2-dehydro-3-deoxygalactonokinase [Paracoccaceae bacterium]